MKKDDKTNVMRLLEQKKVPYESHSYEPDATIRLLLLRARATPITYL